MKTPVGEFDRVMEGYPPPPAWPTTQADLIDYYTQLKIFLRQRGFIGAATEQRFRKIVDR